MTDGGNAQTSDVGTWAPLRVRAFRLVWLAALVSNLGSWMHLVAAGWLMTSLTTSAGMVALLLTASSLPSFALALPAGAMADVFDRRRLILFSQGVQLLVAAMLGMATVVDAMSPGLLLALTVALGAMSTLGLPAYTALTPELVSRDQLPAAIGLNSMTATATQAVGPALGGLLVASVGAGAVFLLNAVSFVAILIAVAGWRPRSVPSSLPTEHIGAAVRTGLRYTANAPELVAVLVRAAGYVAGFSALPSLLVVLTRRELGGTAGEYGLLLGMVGLGGVTGALLLRRLRARLTADTLVAAATLIHAATILGLAQLHDVVPAVPLLALAGFVAMATMSSLNIAAQEVLPAWVRGRGLAVFQLVFQLTFAAGAALWGTVASNYGVRTALVAGAAVIASNGLLGLRFRLSAADGVDVSHAYRSEPHVEVHVDGPDAPVLVTTDYRVPPEVVDDLRAIAAPVRRVRRREGAMAWSLYQDLERPNVHVETYVVASFDEHRREGQRRTATDQAILDRIESLHVDPDHPVRRYLLAHRFGHHAAAPRIIVRTRAQTRVP